jgi:hypothetical protein
MKAKDPAGRTAPDIPADIREVTLSDDISPSLRFHFENASLKISASKNAR